MTLQIVEKPLTLAMKIMVETQSMKIHWVVAWEFEMTRK
jgi:hypothetical protein